MSFSEELRFTLNTGISGQKIFFSSDLMMWQKDRFPMKEVAGGLYEYIIPAPWIHEINYKFILDDK